ncbi:hypothetical protein Goklo_021772 [Gossypium klotzschianum]|uniref:Uncharacterized protein n=1 Tax=Gossypium klotzschianum TaxID=34286 RepID=A0A7J8UXC1_9ROSI|nr:hypothetical protein [Gossypium klotzschianum]
MATFPSPVERTVASALLLLSTQPPKLTIGCSDGETKGETSMSEENKLRLMPSNESESGSSSLTSHQLSSRKQQKLRIIAAVARCHEMKLKVSLPYSVSPLFAVVKRRRSKICWSSDDRKTSSFKSLISRNMATAETTSCLLLKKEEVKRSGTGGQKDPYIYTVTIN